MKKKIVTFKKEDDDVIKKLKEHFEQGSWLEQRKQSFSLFTDKETKTLYNEEKAVPIQKRSRKLKWESKPDLNELKPKTIQLDKEQKRRISMKSLLLTRMIELKISDESGDIKRDEENKIRCYEWYRILSLFFTEIIWSLPIGTTNSNHITFPNSVLKSEIEKMISHKDERYLKDKENRFNVTSIMTGYINRVENNSKRKKPLGIISALGSDKKRKTIRLSTAFKELSYDDVMKIISSPTDFKHGVLKPHLVDCGWQEPITITDQIIEKIPKDLRSNSYTKKSKIEDSTEKSNVLDEIVEILEKDEVTVKDEDTVKDEVVVDKPSAFRSVKITIEEISEDGSSRVINIEL